MAKISLWDLRTGKKIQTISLTRPDGRTKRIAQLFFAPDGKTLVLASLDDVLLLDLASAMVRASFESRPSAIINFAVSPDCKALALALASANGKCSVQMWEFGTGKLIRGIHDSESLITAIAFSADGKFLAFSTKNNIFVSDPGTGMERCRFPAQMEKFANLIFSPDGKTLISGSEDSGKVIVWDIAAGKVQQSLGNPTIPLRSLALSPDGKTVAVGSQGSTVRLWDVAVGKELFSEFQGHDSQINCLAFSLNGKKLVSGGDFQQIRLWDTAIWTQTGLIQGNAKTLSISPDGKRLATVPALLGKTARVWNVATGQDHLTITVPDSGDVLTAVFSPDGQKIFTLDRKRDVGGDSSGPYRLRHWDATTGKEIQWWALPAKIDPLLLAADGKSVVGRGTGTIPHFDAEWGHERTFRLDDNGEIWALALASDGKILASGVRTPNFTVRLWEMTTAKEIFLLEGHECPVSAIAWSPDGRILATGDQRNDRISLSPDGRIMVIGDQNASNKLPVSQTVRLWDTVSGKELSRFGDFKADVMALTFSPDGAHLVAGLKDSTILVWEVGIAALKLTPEKLDNQQFEAHWAELAGDDARKAHQAAWKLSTSPYQSLPYLRGRLKPVLAVDASKIQKLIADLDNDKFAVRETARRELEMIGAQVKPSIEKALKGKPAMETRQRLELIAKSLSGVPGATTLRTLRAIMVLERIGSPEARSLLQVLADGAEGARETEEAKAALARLARRSP